MMISPTLWRRVPEARMETLHRVTRKSDIYVFFHSDGNFEPIIPDLIEIDVNILDPVQSTAWTSEVEGSIWRPFNPLRKSIRAENITVWNNGRREKRGDGTDEDAGFLF